MKTQKTQAFRQTAKETLETTIHPGHESENEWQHVAGASRLIEMYFGSS
ncbi:MAG: hypothetical protein GTO45_39325 [Candidatus Aminicenantes bacterium]|nr:hypothetical protein [Candidatus Aminicenantes bacterium]NIM84681.1 hypothetical protein [Candidatus Aminicenantes bacterium]NIN24180.1 hypothetical protein [Candidatus Aminicenantes bacterium]NIN47905.1 hypothetical protein [Candidatus Aminicenantes bacterium]NIN90843.1 hypothetical protein [Candidatus Aminicenantes bacterium]